VRRFGDGVRLPYFTGRLRGEMRVTKKRVTRFLLGGLAVAVAVVVLLAMFVPSDFDRDLQMHRGPAQLIGRQMPDVKVERLGDGPIDTNAFRGRDVLVNVWATWCGPCRREMPALERLSKAEGNRLVIVAIDQGEDASTVGSYAKRFGLSFPVAVDDGQTAGTVLHLIGLPSSFFVDRSGTIRDAVDGEMTYDMMTSKARSLIAGG
jgi:thiol-disulfide isomerase/thioredoxin